jgi:hypothetical protein
MQCTVKNSSRLRCSYSEMQLGCRWQAETRQAGRQGRRQAGKACRQASTQTGRKGGRQAVRRSRAETDRQAGRQGRRQAGKAGRQRHRQLGKYADRQERRQAGRQSGKEAPWGRLADKETVTEACNKAGSLQGGRRACEEGRQVRYRKIH